MFNYYNPSKIIFETGFLSNVRQKIVIFLLFSFLITSLGRSPPPVNNITFLWPILMFQSWLEKE